MRPCGQIWNTLMDSSIFYLPETTTWSIHQESSHTRLVFKEDSWMYGPVSTVFKSTIVSGKHWFEGIGWGGPELRFGGYYGARTIQGLASYYYGHLERNRSIELNRCHYNTMVDEPTHFSKKLNETLCPTMEETCQDCGKTPIKDIYTTHFTSECGKLEWCYTDHELRLCMQLFYKWHEVRWSLEEEWSRKYPGYIPKAANVTSLHRKSKSFNIFEATAETRNARTIYHFSYQSM